MHAGNEGLEPFVRNVRNAEPAAMAGRAVEIGATGGEQSEISRQRLEMSGARRRMLRVTDLQRIETGRHEHRDQIVPAERPRVRERRDAARFADPIEGLARAPRFLRNERRRMPTEPASERLVQRRDVLARASRVLVENQLRPGAEASRAEAELAAARTRAIQARQAVVIARNTLSQMLGIPGGVVDVNASRVLDAVRRFAEGAEPYDDITLVAIARGREEAFHA